MSVVCRRLRSENVFEFEQAEADSSVCCPLYVRVRVERVVGESALHDTPRAGVALL